MHDQQQIPDRQMISVAELKARGWTDGIILRHLGKPDRTTVNPYYRSGARRCLYALQRIITAEQGPARTDLERAALRRTSRKECKPEQPDEVVTAEVIGGRFDGARLPLLLVHQGTDHLRVLETEYRPTTAPLSKTA